MRLVTCRSLCLALAITTLSAGNRGVAQEDPGLSSAYQREVDAALVDHEAGRYEAARAHFLRAHEAFPSARTLRGLGKVEFELGNYVDALGYLEAALVSQARPLPTDLREEVGALIARSRELQGEPVVVVQPAAVLVDGASEPGPRMELTAPVPPAPAPPQRQDTAVRSKWWLWTAGGLVLAGAVTATALLATREREPHTRPVAPGATWTVGNP